MPTYPSHEDRTFHRAKKNIATCVENFREETKRKKNRE